MRPREKAEQFVCSGCHDLRNEDKLQNMYETVREYNLSSVRENTHECTCSVHMERMATRGIMYRPHNTGKYISYPQVTARPCAQHMSCETRSWLPWHKARAGAHTN